MSSRATPAMKAAEIVMMIGQLIGIWISGAFLFRVWDFAFRAISNMRIPVRLPDMIPPIPMTRVKLANLNCSARM